MTIGSQQLQGFQNDRAADHDQSGQHDAIWVGQHEYESEHEEGGKVLEVSGRNRRPMEMGASVTKAARARATHPAARKKLTMSFII